MKAKKGKPVADALKLISKLDKWMLPLLLLKSLFVAAVPFIITVLSAEVINRLSVQREFMETLVFAIVSVTVVFLFTVTGDFLKKTCEVRQSQCNRLYNFAKNEKNMDMDFSGAESPAVNSLRNKLKQQESMGFSFPLLFGTMDIITGQALISVMALAILIPLLITTGSLPPIGVAAFLTVSALISITVAILRKKTDDKQLDMIKDDHFWPDVLMESEALYFGGAYTYKEGKYMRVYEFHKAIRKRIDGAMKFMLTTTKDFATKPGAVYGLLGAARGLIMGGSFAFVVVCMRGDTDALGNAVLLASLLYQFSLGISRTISNTSTFLSVTESLQLYHEFVAAPNINDSGTLLVNKDRSCEHIIEFRNISFKYPGSDAYALEDFSMKLDAGKRLAIVGENGSGKSTMIKLLCRLYEPDEGEILLDGINISKYDLKDYQSVYSVIFQDFKLFSLQLGQVVAAAKEYDAAKAESCLIKAGMQERLRDMPDGVRTPLFKDFEDGVDVSGGESQKIAMARALYRDAPIFVFDEPTSALDPISEFEVYSKFNEIIGDRSAMFISHRLSSCRFCDDIAVLHEGKLIERGSHDDLVSEAEGKYHQLWNAQAQYYRA